MYFTVVYIKNIVIECPREDKMKMIKIKIFVVVHNQVHHVTVK